MPDIVGFGTWLMVGLLYSAIPLGTLVFFGWLGLRFVRTREHESLARGSAVTREELMRVEEQVQALESEIRSLHERQAFTEKLLERPRESP